uniref:superoxide dismutase n=1 Tax=Diabrotica virgifera virgifera TaxID=50390 RepID=A0A6P7H4M1_DIAVI
MFKIALCAAILAIAYAQDGIVYLMDPSGMSGVTGTVRFVKLPTGINVIGDIRGLKPGKHGFHIHQEGHVRACSSTGRHFTRLNEEHADRTVYYRHTGDLGNIVADQNGAAFVNFVDTIIDLVGNHSIIGRALVVHEMEDDFAESKNESLLTADYGQSGGRIACGVIGIRSIC